jgi:hypothetical protein
MSNQLKIKLYFLIESNVFWLNWIKSSANWIKWHFWFLIQFNSIWTKTLTRNILNCISGKIWEVQQTGSQKILSDISAILLNNHFENWPVSRCSIFFMTVKAVLYQVESFFRSDQNRIKSKAFCNFLIKNQIKSKPIQFDSPGQRLVSTWRRHRRRCRHRIVDVDAAPLTSTSTCRQCQRRHDVVIDVGVEMAPLTAMWSCEHNDVAIDVDITLST